MHLIHVIVTTVTCLALGSSLALASNLQDKAPSAGNSDPANIFLLEESAQALAVAVKSGLQDVTVLHIDNSDDLWPAPTEEQTAKAKALLSKGDFETFETAGRALIPGTERLYSYVNHLVMAHRLGIIKEVYWAVPSLEAFDVQGLQAIMATPLNRSTPFAPNEGTSLEIAMPRIKGTISGVPVTIGLLRHFKPNNTPLWVDIELDYFSPLYKNPVSSSYLGLLSGFVNAYQKLAIEPQLLTITYGNADGQLPLKNRYLGPWLKTMLVKPEILSSTPPASWLAKEEALYHDFFVQTDDAITILGNVLEQVPNNPDIHYTLGIMLIKLGQMKQAQRSLTRASSLDQAFSLGILDYLMLASATQDPEHVDSLLNSAVRSGYASPLMLRAAALRAKESSDHEQTIRLLRQLIEAGDDSPAVYAMLGQSYSKTGRDKEALESFQKAMALLKQPPHTDQLPGAWLSLAEHQEITGDFQAAELTYQEYLALFPYEPQERQELVKKRLDKLSAQDGK